MSLLDSDHVRQPSLYSADATCMLTSVCLRKLSCHTTNTLEIVKVTLFFPPNQMDSRAALPFFVATAHDGRLKELSLSSVACLEIDSTVVSIDF